MGKKTKETRKTSWTKQNLRNTGLQSANRDTSQVGSLSPLAQIVQLQQTVGNQAVVHLIQRATSEDVIQRSKKRKREGDDTDVDNDMQTEEDATVAATVTSETEGEVSHEAENATDVNTAMDTLVDAETDGPKNNDEKKEPVFWTRLVVRSAEDDKPKTADKDSFIVYKVSISPERRMTARGKEQGDHLIPWSAMYRYWNEELSNKPLPYVLGKLKNWITSDQAADQLVNFKKLDQNTEKRSQALFLINKIETETLSANKIHDLLEQAISLFVEANQASSFAVKGKNTGGNAEARAQAELAKLNDEMRNNQNANQNMVNIIINAQKLLDLHHKNFHPITLAKVVYTWYTMLTEKYSNLKVLLKDALSNYKIRDHTVGYWLQEWEKHEDKWKKQHGNSWIQSWEKYENDWKKQQEDSSLQKDGNQRTDQAQNTMVQTGVLAAVGNKKDPLLGASQVVINQVEIPQNQRAKTNFGTKQGSHTLAWTFKRISLIEMFHHCKADELLRKLAKLTERDKKSLDSETGYGDLKAQAENLYKKIVQEQLNQYSLHKWIEVVNKLFAEYIELNQKLPTTTYELDIPKGRGEAAANKEFQKTRSAKTLSDTQYKKLRKLAPKYIDIGVFYRDILDQAYSNQYTLRQRHHYEPQTKRKKRADSTVDSPQNSNNSYVILKDTEKYLEKLYEQNQPLLSKVFGDFYLHLKYFHPAFYKRFKNDPEGKQKFVANVFIAPLTKDTVFEIIRGRLDVFGDANTFIKGLINGILAKSAAWSEELLPTPAKDSPSEQENHSATAANSSM